MQEQNVMQICQVAQQLTDALNDQLNKMWVDLCCAAEDLQAVVSELPITIEAVPTEQRFSAFCRELERMEQCKRVLDEAFSCFLGGEISIAEATMRLLGWEGEMRLRKTGDAASVELIGGLRARLDAYAETYTKERVWAEGLIRGMFPRFLDELYRLSDAERNGKGFRMQSIADLCGGFCNNIKFS